MNSNFVAAEPANQTAWRPSKSCPPKQPHAGRGHRPIGHESTLVNKPLLWVNSRQSVFVGKLDDPLSFNEKAAIGGRHNRVDLLLPCGLKGALYAFGIELSLDLFQS